MLLEFIEIITEAADSARTPHPEDFVFKGSKAATDAINGMLHAIASPKSVSIKWDGSPAIIFGRRDDGKFTMNYKSYIATPGGQVTSPQELLQFYAARNANADVAAKLADIFNELSTIVPQGFKGFVLGDLMWTDPVPENEGNYTFKANPHGVTYVVAASSNLGAQIKGRKVGIAVHSYGDNVEPSFDVLMNKRPLDGLGGLSGTNQYVTVITATLGNTFKLTNPVKQISAAQKAVATHGAQVDTFLANLTGGTKGKLQQYYNRKITGQPVDAAWIEANVTKPQLALLTSDEGRAALAGLDAMWAAIYVLKVALVQQLDPQVQGIQQFTNGKPQGEGFAVMTPSGLVKLVNRQEFSAANVAGRQ